MKNQLSNQPYADFLAEVKAQIKSSQAKAALHVNSALIEMYWRIGAMIAENQALFTGRNNYIEQLAKDLKAEFPGVSGFSRTNLFSIRRFFLFYNSNSVQQAVALNDDAKSIPQLLAQITWGHHVLILNKVKEKNHALFYVRQTLEYNWTRAVLTLQIEQNLFARQGAAVTNFAQVMPAQQAQIAEQILKDPYNFDFLTLEQGVQELEIEKQLTARIEKNLKRS